MIKTPTYEIQTNQIKKKDEEKNIKKKIIAFCKKCMREKTRFKHKRLRIYKQKSKKIKN